MNITVMGAGYVGLVTAACFAELGNHVTCIDIDHHKIHQLQHGKLPIYEPHLAVMIKNNVQAGRLFFATALNEVFAEQHIIFIAVGTPSNDEGAAEIKYVLEAARDIGRHIKNYCIIVDKSTVPVGMSAHVHNVIQKELSERRLQIEFDVISNPEFLREGAAIEDFMRPDRIIIGLSNDSIKHIILDLYLPIVRHPERIFFMSIEDAEMTKYAANAMLATRISFMNEMALLCEYMHVDIENVRIGIGADSRIGSRFLNPGCGYGGSCFPKDVRALIKMAEQHGLDSLILKAVEKRNSLQKKLLVEKVLHHFGNDLSGITLAVWGLAFKPDTDDMREASSLVILEKIIEHGANVQAYDPQAMPMAQKILPAKWFALRQLVFVTHQFEALQNADALLLITEWQSFCFPDIAVMKKLMRRRIIFDGRNQYDPRPMRDAGFIYYGIGRGGGSEGQAKTGRGIEAYAGSSITESQKQRKVALK